MRIYRGRRAPGTDAGAEHLASGPTVVVDEAGVERRLEPAVTPADYAMHVDGDFEWGYGGSGPLNLSAAILNDALGFVPDVTVVIDFCDSVIAELPRLEFELAPDVWQTWLDVRLARACRAAREIAGPQNL